jgi:cytochrome b561
VSRRGLTSALHWACVFLILTMVKGGVATPWVLALFAGLVIVWAGMILALGLQGKPGPKLSPAVRRAYPWMHRALHGLLALTAIAILLRLMGHEQRWLDPWILLLITLAAGTFHGLFHFWRHTALYDGALRLITPKALHKWL